MRKLVVAVLLTTLTVWAIPKIAVADFESIGCEESVGRAVAEIIRTEIAAEGVFRVIERSRLEDVLAEQSLGTSGMVTEGDLVEIGALLGADMVGVGSVSRIGEIYTLSGRIVLVATGEVVAAASRSVDDEEELVEAARELAKLDAEEFEREMAVHQSPAAYDVYMKGVAAVEAGDYPGAVELFARAIELDPEYPQPYLALLKIVVHGERWPMFVDVAEQYLEHHPDGPRADDIRRELAKIESRMNGAPPPENDGR